MTDLVTGSHVRAAADYMTGVLEPATSDPERWEAQAGPVTWSCRMTLAHVAGCCTGYAALLARRASRKVESPGPDTATGPEPLLDVTRSAAALLAVVVAAAGAADLAWHPWGTADRSGFAAMGADEILVHGSDIATGLGLAYDPPPGVCRAILRRIFPWAPDNGSPWIALQWANGRVNLGSRPADPDWRWHNAPLETWDGAIPRKQR
jgi:hypothetical protein